MKICFLTENIFSIGGVSRVVTTLANQMVNSNKVDIICVRPNTKVNYKLYGLNNKIKVKVPIEMSDDKRKFFLRRIFRRINQKLFKIPGMSLLEWIYLPKKLLNNYISYLNECDYDVIIAVQGKESLILGKIADKLKCTCIGWQHNSNDAYFNTCNRYYWNQKELFSKYIPNLDNYVVLTDDDCKKFNEKNISNVCRIYNPVDYVEKDEIDKDKSQYDLVFVGRLVKEQKGLDYLSEIIYKVKMKYPKVKVVIIGDGEDRKFLEEDINKRGINESVTFVGQTNNVNQYYSKAKILLSTSRWEGFGLVLVEAMQYKIPIVTFETTGPKEIIGLSKSGFIIKKYDVDAFVDKVCLLLSNNMLLGRMGENAAIRAKDFSTEKIVDEWYELLYKNKSNMGINNYEN